MVAAYIENWKKLLIKYVYVNNYKNVHCNANICKQMLTFGVDWKIKKNWKKIGVNYGHLMDISKEKCDSSRNVMK